MGGRGRRRGRSRAAARRCEKQSENRKRVLTGRPGGAQGWEVNEKKTRGRVGGMQAARIMNWHLAVETRDSRGDVAFFPTETAAFPGKMDYFGRKRQRRAGGFGARGTRGLEPQPSETVTPRSHHQKTALPCSGKTPYVPSGVAKLPFLKH